MLRRSLVKYWIQKLRKDFHLQIYLLAIPPLANTVGYIEVKRGINVLYWSVGGNGILAIYTNDVTEQVREEKVFLYLS
jgi:hypothetical protein